MSGERPPGLISAIVAAFLEGKPSILFLILACCLGAAAVLLTPREEEPQIIVPLADILVHYPGGSAQEVEKLVSTRLERLLWQIDGVEYVYSTAERDRAVVTVRFYVGEDRERSLVKLHNRISSHIDEAAPGVTAWVVKPVEIDDVPIVSLTLWSATRDDAELRRLGEELLARLDPIEDLSRTTIVGGRPRQIRVELDPERMRARGVSTLDLLGVLQAADVALPAGALLGGNRQVDLRAGPFVESADDVRSLVVGVSEGAPIYLEDVAQVLDGPAEPGARVRISFGPQAAAKAGTGAPGAVHPAVTLAFAKKQGTNAVWVARQVLAAAERLGAELLPPDVHVVVTRNQGRSADQKVNELLQSLAFAIVAVVALLLFTLGWREALVVALAVPVSFALALAVNLLAGFTINRVTLFALILSLGLVVDDPITNVDNIQRHILARRREPRLAVLWAVREVLPPVIISTLAIIVSFTPMFFITGMMGPYMGPMAINVPLTVTFSTVCALTIVPWMAHRLLSGRQALVTETGQDVTPGWIKATYGWVVGGILASNRRCFTFLFAVLLLLCSTGLLVLTGRVPLKMLPFDNKNELQLVLDLPEGTAVEGTAAACEPFEAYLAQVNEVVDLETYVGTSSPMDFNGLVRHYYFRHEPHQADIRINLVEKGDRQQQSHDFALRLRRDLEQLARQVGADLKIVEVPPGPPVLATLVAEVYGAEDTSHEALVAAAREVRARMEQEPCVSDVDILAEAPHTHLAFVTDREKAALHGVATDELARTLSTALGGHSPAGLHDPRERMARPILVRLPQEQRTSLTQLSQLPVRARDGSLVELGELGSFEEVPQDQPIYHKNLRRVVYVMAEVVGRPPAEAVLSLAPDLKARPPGPGIQVEWAGEGEWKITLRVFRDLGLAFGAALVGIYVLLVLQTGSWILPMVIMSAIPLTAIGILPGFWLLNLVAGHEVGGFASPVFFTATAMIGMIALGGIVVRNSVVLIEFIKDSRAEGTSLREAILQSGAVRLRPIVLTALTTALGALPITLDPIFSGLAWALIFGLVASTAFSLVVVPVVYWLIYRE